MQHGTQPPGSEDVRRIADNAVAFPALGTTIEVLVTDPGRLEGVTALIRDRIAEVDRTFSRFRSDSELLRLERLPGVRQPASPLFLELLERALRAARDTDGWFDPTIRDALEAAGYDRSMEEIEATGPGAGRRARPAGQWRQVRYDRGLRWVILPDGAPLDFGGIGKGFAVDYALRGLPPGACGALLNAGGDLACVGPVPEDGWLCDVAADAQAPVETTIALYRGALATSGLGRRQWTRGGARLHHLIDPHTGAPASSPWRTVTVAAGECAAAEVAAKVAWLRGFDGLSWLRRLGLAGRFVSLDGRVQTVGPWPGADEAQTGTEPDA